jgi:hypothetical protein
MEVVSQWKLTAVEVNPVSAQQTGLAITKNPAFSNPNRVGRLSWPLLACPFFLLTGCVTTSSYIGSDRPATDICRVVAAWHPEVVFTPDPVHNGQPTPGIAGRIYLFGETIDYPRVGDGSLVVDLYRDGPASADPESLDKVVPLEEWRIDPQTLKRLKRKDAVGWGYTVFLPWGTYKPEIKKVELRVRYVPVKGSPLYAQSAPLVLDSSGTANKVTVTHRTERVVAKKTDQATAAVPAPASSEPSKPAQ